MKEALFILAAVALPPALTALSPATEPSEHTEPEVAPAERDDVHNLTE